MENLETGLSLGAAAFLFAAACMVLWRIHSASLFYEELIYQNIHTEHLIWEAGNDGEL